jgi:hypothetical protein
MEENETRDDSLAEEFRQLGRNLTAVMASAWDRPERKKLQGEIANALSELSTILRTEAQKVSESPTGQRVRTEAQDIRERIRGADVESRARQELSGALRAANDALRQAVTRISTEPGENERREPEEEERRNPGVPEEDRQSTPMKDTGHREIHPDDVESDPSKPSERQEVHPDDAE